MARNEQPREPTECAVEMAAAAVEDSPRPSPLDMDMSGIDPDPTSLAIDVNRQVEVCLEPSRRARGRCACGRLLPRS